MGLGATVALQLVLVATGGDTYAEAHKATAEKGCLLVVMVGATWCPACQHMKNSVIPEIKRQGILQNVAFAEVDLDQEQELGAELTHGGPIPQIVIYRKTPLGWRLGRLVGGQDVQTVEKFITQGLNDEANERPKDSSPGEQPRKQRPAKVAAATTATPQAKSATIH